MRQIHSNLSTKMPQELMESDCGWQAGPLRNPQPSAFKGKPRGICLPSVVLGGLTVVLPAIVFSQRQKGHAGVLNVNLASSLEST